MGVLFRLLLNIEKLMRTNIIIDDTLMSDVLKVTGVKSKREAVELGLKTLLMLKSKNLLKHLKAS